MYRTEIICMKNNSVVNGFGLLSRPLAPGYTENWTTRLALTETTSSPTLQNVSARVEKLAPVAHRWNNEKRSRYATLRWKSLLSPKTRSGVHNKHTQSNHRLSSSSLSKVLEHTLQFRTRLQNTGNARLSKAVVKENYH